MKRGKFVLAAIMMMMGIGAAGPAFAEVATTNVNVRETPGGRVLTVMRAGEQARIVDRSGSWCQVRWDGPRGWVACRYLAAGGGGGIGGGGGGGSGIGGGFGSGDISIEFSIPGFSFSIGDGGFDWDRGGRGDRRARVCFYEHVGYDGASFCARPGERLRSLGSWNDRISSIRVTGNAEAQVCEHDGFRGRCVTINRSVRDLGRRGNDIISSIRVR